MRIIVELLFRGAWSGPWAISVKDTSSKGSFIQGMICPRDMSFKRLNIQRTKNPGETVRHISAVDGLSWHHFTAFSSESKYCTGPPTFVSIVPGCGGWSLVSGFGPIGVEFFISVVDPDTGAESLNPDPDLAFQVNSDTDPGFWWTKVDKKILQIFFFSYFSKFAI